MPAPPPAAQWPWRARREAGSAIARRLMAAQMKAIPVNWNKVFSVGVAGVVSNTRPDLHRQGNHEEVQNVGASASCPRGKRSQPSARWIGTMRR
jgi:hypothetical protein